MRGFLNNEPRYLEPILSEFEAGRNYALEVDESLPGSIVPWKERYMLTVWLSHLMLAPFPLASMSGFESSQSISATFGIGLPDEVPQIALRILKVCIEGLKSASKERNAGL